LAEAAEDGDVIIELIEQDGSGTILFDAEAGLTVESTSVQTNVMEGEFMGNEIALETENTVIVVQGTSDDLPKSETEAPAEEAADDKPADDSKDEKSDQ
jgi:hypothetical protein